MEAAENVGTKSAPLMTDVMNSLHESASSQVIQAAASNIYLEYNFEQERKGAG